MITQDVKLRTSAEQQQQQQMAATTTSGYIHRSFTPGNNNGYINCISNYYNNNNSMVNNNNNSDYNYLLLQNNNYSSERLNNISSSTSCWNTTTPGIPVAPAELFFNDEALMAVVCYTVLFIIAAAGNLTVFITLFRNRRRRSRVNIFIMHLCLADMTVTFIFMPLEIFWNLSVSWQAGDIMCRIMMFFRAFGFYLSSFVLVVISLDRHYAILKPMSVSNAHVRARRMLMVAWCASIIASIPQVSYLLN